MIKKIGGFTWFCCPECGKKLHPVNRGAHGVFTQCRGKLPDGRRCGWRGEVRYDPDWDAVVRGVMPLNEYKRLRHKNE